MDNELGVGVVVNAIKGLPIALGYGLSLYDVGDPKHNILLSTKYNVTDALIVMLDANFAFVTATDYAVEVEADYAIGKEWTAGVNLEYGTNGYGPLADSGFFAYPWIQANVGTAHTLKLGFQFETDPSIWSIPFFYSIFLRVRDCELTFERSPERGSVLLTLDPVPSRAILWPQ